MANIPIAKARRTALDRMVRVLREQYATILDELAREQGVFGLTAPEPEHIFRIEPGTSENLLANAPVWVSVVPTSPLSPTGVRGSAGMTNYCIPTEFEATALLIFQEPIMELPAQVARPDGTDPAELEKLDLQAELLAFLVDIYSGALTQTLLKYTQVRECVADIEFVGDQNRVLVNPDGALFGSASTTVSLRQNVLAPKPAPLPTT